MSNATNPNVIPDPTADLHWGDFRGAIQDIFATNALQFPDRLCVEETPGPSTPGRSFTYKQIHESSNLLAHYLLAKGCQRGDVVMVYAHRGVDLVVAYMGALKAGAAVSVLDPLYPPERQKVLLEVANPSFLIHIKRAVEEAGHVPQAVQDFICASLCIKAEIPLLELCDDGCLKGGCIDDSIKVIGAEDEDCLAAFVGLRSQPTNVMVGPDSTPTLSFTSGSEGRPKGVLGRHFSLTYYFPWMAQRFGLSEIDRFTMLSGIAHDPIQRDIFTPLFLGATLVVPHRDSIGHEILAEWMKKYRITVTHLTPAMGQILVGGATAQFLTLHHAFFVGDLLTKKDCRRLQDLAPNVHIVNMYGTTETQRAVSYYELPSKALNPTFLESMPDIIPVGQGMFDVQLLVVDRENRSRICNVGEQGELFIRAGGLAEGYLGDDEKTAKLNRSKFVPTWFLEEDKWSEEYSLAALALPQPWMQFYKGPRDRLYRTGDLGHFRADGTVECTGRIDNQVKIRGFRIEVGEIDTHLSRHPFIRENVTTIRRNKDEEPTLVSYIVPEAKRWFEEQGLVAPEELDHGPASSDEPLLNMLKRYKALSESCKSFLRAHIPAYAVPSIIIPLARMPLSEQLNLARIALPTLTRVIATRVIDPNGKIDKPALPFPDETDLASLRRRASRQSFAMTDTQKKLATIWAAVIPSRTARMFVPTSNFFNEGGHSILAQQMFFYVRREWANIDLPMTAIFQSQTLESFAAEIDRAQDPTGLRLDAMLPSACGIRDEAYAADAHDLANRLPTSLATAPQSLDASTPFTVFLTGATGFLGSYVLRELLVRTKAHVIAHVRCTDPSAGLDRIEATCRAYGFWSPEWRNDKQSRLEVIRGDISRRRLGLLPEDWNRVATSADIVIHNGAQVNWMLPYSSLSAANVHSTADCVLLCDAFKAKRLVFVSSTSALDNEHYIQHARESVAAGGKGVSESDPLEGSRRGLATGYGQTKWASEYIVREAGRRGLSGTIVRPGYVTGDPETGATITDDFLVRLWKGCLQVRSRPDICNTVNQVPVTQVARLVVASAIISPAQPLGVVQVTSHPRLTLNDWLGALELYGYELPKVAYSYWVDALREYVGDTPLETAASTSNEREELALLPLFHMVTNNLPSNSIAPDLDDINAAAVLRHYGGQLSESTVTVDIIGKYIAYLVAIRFLPPPPSQGVLGLPECTVSAGVGTTTALGGRGGNSR